MLELAILGLLQEQPRHGYELKKVLRETLGSFWGVSFGSLYPALRRLERSGAIEVVDDAPAATEPAMPATGSLKGEAAAARLRLVPPAKSGRTRKAYRITPAGQEQFQALLADDDGGADDERLFTVKLSFCRFLDPDARLAFLERRRAELADRLSRARRSRGPSVDRYTRSLIEHRTRSTERDLEWIDDLIASEHHASEGPDPSGAEQEGATA